MIGICEKAGLPKSELVSASRDTTEDFSRVHAIATDDIMLMSTDRPRHSSQAAAQVYRAMNAAGMIKYCGKDINDSTDATCIGLAL